MTLAAYDGYIRHTPPISSFNITMQVAMPDSVEC